MITRLDPNGQGTYADFTPSAGTETSCVDDGASASDADYVYLDGAGFSTYTLTDLPDGAADITSTTLTARMKRDGGNYLDGGLRYRIDGTTNIDVAKTLQGGTYRNETDTATLTPSAWPASRINSMEVGIRSLGSFPGEAVFCSWIKFDVTHEMVSGGGFACLVGSLVGAALGLAEMAQLARVVYRNTRSLITPGEYEAAWRDIRGHRWPKVYEVRG